MGVFDGVVVGGAVLVDVFDHGREGGGFAGAGGAADENQAGVLVALGDDMAGNAEFFGGGDLRPDEAQDHGEVITLIVKVAADAAGGRDVLGEVELAGGAQVGHAVFTEQLAGESFDVGWLAGGSIKAVPHAGDAHRGGVADHHEEVGGAARLGGDEHFFERERHRPRGGSCQAVGDGRSVK